MQDTPTVHPNAPRRKRAMSRRAVQKAIRAKFGSIKAFAGSLDRNVSFVSEVLWGHEVSSPIARAIADVVGREPHEIWPRLYAEDGEPLKTLFRRAS